VSEPIETPEPVYTTAIIAAIPAADDPIHAHVAEDAHITMIFLGQAADIPAEAVEQIKDDLSTIGAHLPAFPVEASGTAILGDDEANVVLIESQTLTNLRNLLTQTPEIQAALEASAEDQFPNWLPHLTLAYPDDDGMATPVQTPPVDTVTIGALALWLGGDKYEYPLQPAAPVYLSDSEYEEEPVEVVTAAADAKATFDNSLHPRGADGRFIEKFSVIKYLTSGSWTYGKVEGIYKDPNAGGAVKIHVVPSDLGGKYTGKPAVDLVPGQIYHAPKQKAHLTIGAPGTKKIGGQGGSNPGGLYEIPKPSSGTPTDDGGLDLGAPSTEKFYVKKAQTAAHGKNEALANDFYAEAGVPAPQVDFNPGDGQIYSKIVDGKQDMPSHLSDPVWLDQVRRNFAVDAWLGNRDVFGMEWDNIITDPQGTAWRIDNGGALLYRAQGAKKTDFGSQVTELEAFRQGKKSKIFGAGMSKDQELDGAQRVLAISPTRIEQMVADAGMPKSLADTLKARRLYLADYYGLELPESKKPEGAEGPTSAPLVDAADLAISGGKPRTWFPAQLSHGLMLLQTGDRVAFPDGSVETYGVPDDNDGIPLSTVGAQAQLLGWMSVWNGTTPVLIEKHALKTSSWPRPKDGGTLKGADLASQRWERGDALISSDQQEYRILGVNTATGGVLVQAIDQPVRLLDTFGADSANAFTIKRWDPPIPDEQPEPTLADKIHAIIDQHDAAGAPKIETLKEPGEPGPVDTAPKPNPTGGYPFPPVTVNAPTEKTGQAAAAEAKIKADLNTPLPTGNGAPAPTKTSAKSGEKKMLIGDGTEATPGVTLLSKKDGKTYTFVKPKGQYAVVTDQHSDTPDKQLLKLASTMTQPGAAKVADPSEIEKPKTATGEVPELGMMAVSKDGHAGEITLISPDGKFVFITDSNGTRKRKSTGTVSITSKTQSSVDTPKTATGPIKGYGATPSAKWSGEEKVSGWFKPGDAELNAVTMVHVGYVDGSDGLEPYTGQPLSSLEKNANGDVAIYGTPSAYLGPMAASHMVTVGNAQAHSTVYEVIWNGSVFFTDGSTGPSNGLNLWYASKDGGAEADAFEMDPQSSQVLTVIANGTSDDLPLNHVQDGIAYQAHDGDTWSPSPAPLYGEEAKTLNAWKGQINEGDQISLDGKNWLTVTNVMPSSGSLEVVDSAGTGTYLNGWSSATYVIKAPELKNGDAPESSVLSGKPEPTIQLAVDITNTPLKKVSELVPGDVILDDKGNAHVVSNVLPGGVHSVDVSVYDLPDPIALEDYAEFPHLGNAHNGVVDMPIATAFPLLAPGHKVFPSPGKSLTVASFPKLQEDGKTWKVAVFHDGNPADLSIMESGHFGEHVSLPVDISTSKSAESNGVDPKALQELWEKGYVIQHVPAEDADHGWAMQQAGIEPGKAAYPVFFDPTENLYFRNGPTGVEKWDTGKVPSQWVNDPKATTATLQKVWDGHQDGQPLETKLNPASPELAFPPSALYVPKPGEVVQQATWGDYPGGSKSFLIAYPTGNTNDPAYMVMGETSLSSTPFGAKNNWAPGQKVSDDWKAAYSDFTTIHDPFAEEKPGGQKLTHQDGPAPQQLSDFFASSGYTPQPGQQFRVVSEQVGDGGYDYSARVYLRQDDGSWARIKNDGTVSVSPWSEEDIAETFGGDGHTQFTWTAPTAAGEPTGVQGLPEGYAPIVPGNGQSVLLYESKKQGLTYVYLQQQPGDQWVLVNQDGSVDPDSTVTNFIVQKKLEAQGKGAGPNQWSFTLLHDGTVPQGAGTNPPAFSGYTPGPGDQILKVGGAGDPNPWFYVNQGAGVWFKINDGEVDPWDTGTGNSYSDEDVQKWLTDPKYKYVHEVVWPVDTVDTTAKTEEGGPAHTFKAPSGTGEYEWKPGQKVVKDEQGEIYVQSEPGGMWQIVKDDGTLSDSGLSDGYMQAAEDEHMDITPSDAPAPAQGTDAPTSFHGYTPKDGEKILAVGKDNPDHFVQAAEGGEWKKIDPALGLPKAGAGVSDSTVQSALKNQDGTVTLVHPVEKPGGVFNGYQADSGDAVVQLSGPKGTDTLVKKAGSNTWFKVQDDGTLLNSSGGMSQDTVEWAASIDNIKVTELQGSLKGSGSVDTPLTSDKYAGMTTSTLLLPGQYVTADGTQLDPKALVHINHLMLSPGESAYAMDDVVLKRSSAGEWFFVNKGIPSPTPDYSSDKQLENDLAVSGGKLQKIVPGVPQAAPAKSLASDNPTISNWAGKVPDPSGFTAVETGTPMAKGTWVYSTAPYSATPNSGVFFQLAEDYSGTGNMYVAKAYTAPGGKLDEDPTGADPDVKWPIAWSDAATYYAADLTAPSAAKPSAAEVLDKPKPAYPGAQPPSQEDINAWGGDLTKDGHIPTTGMFVTGKGPMSGKIVSVSKDKTKATVLKADGTKTSRLISALKTDKSANYVAYAAPASTKPVPAGMPLAVDTMHEAVTQTVKDGKFRAILHGHAGVSHGEVVVTKATGPSGKAYARVHLTLTPAQRDQLTAMLSGKGEKGDWVSKSKSSDAVAIGDKLPMRLSSQNNPDGSPRWKVDTSVKPPSHEVTKVEPQGGGILQVTLKDLSTGEEITSRFHTGKTLNYYEWDPNKPKAVAPGSFSLNPTAKDQGWNLVNDGGISAAKGGATKAVLYHEPGTAVSKGAFQNASHSWQTLRNVSEDGVVIEVVDPKGSAKNSTTGTVVVSVPEGLDENHLNAAFAKMGIDYTPMTQDSAKENARGLLRTLLDLDTTDVDTAKGWSDDKLFSTAGQAVGISDLGWHDVLVGVDETTGKTSFFWSDRVRSSISQKAQFNVVYRAANTATAAQIVSTVKYGSANSVLKRTTGMTDGTSSTGGGASWSSDQSNHAGHGSYSSAAKVTNLPTSNSQASYKHAGMMIYSRPEAVLGRIADFRLSQSDAFGMGQGTGANHLKYAMSNSKVRDFFIGGGLPAESIGFIAVSSASERMAALQQLQAEGINQINGRPVEDLIITLSQAQSMKASDLPPVTIPANARPILDLPNSYDESSESAA